MGRGRGRLSNIPFIPYFINIPLSVRYLNILYAKTSNLWGLNMAKMIPYDDITGLRGTCTKNGAGYENNISDLVFCGSNLSSRIIFWMSAVLNSIQLCQFFRIIWVAKIFCRKHFIFFLCLDPITGNTRSVRFRVLIFFRYISTFKQHSSQV